MPDPFGPPPTPGTSLTATLFSPADETFGVGIGSNIVVTFSDAIQRGSGNILLKTATGTVVATYDVATSTNLSISGSTLTINPSSDLGIFTGYQVEIASGAIKDLVGNNYAGESNYNFTTQTLDSLYHFSVVAFSAAPGATFMGQMADAYNAGMTVKQIVEIFATKTQFTSTYADSMSNVDFATLLVANVVKDSASAATKTQAINDIVSALTVWSRGDTIYQIFGNLANMPLNDPAWGNTALQFNNQTQVARHFTEVMHNSSIDMPTLKAVVGAVTPATDVSTPQVIATLIGVELASMH
jgi:Bacterial Ig-like domain